MPNRIYKLLFTNTTQSVFELNHKGKIRFVNSAALEMLAHTEDDVVGKPIVDFFPATNDGLVCREDFKNWISDEKERFGTNCQFFSGTHQVFEYRVDWVPNIEEDKVIGHLLMCTDITEHKSYIDKLHTKNQRLLNSVSAVGSINGELCRNMGRDIKKPLLEIIELEKRLEQTQTTKEQQDYINKLTIVSSNLLELIDDVLNIARIESGDIKKLDVEFNLEEFLESTISLLASQTRAKSLDLSFQIEQGTPRNFIGDLTQLTQVLVNIVGNAIKFTDQGEVHISVKVEDENSENIIFQVKDTGRGIPDNKLIKIFNESVGEEELAIARESGGTGLGLHLCKKLIVLLGGKIWAESEIGKGSTFYFSIPLEVIKKDSEISDFINCLRSDCVSIDLKGKKILIVDDNHNERAVLKNMLEEAGAIILEASTVSDAVETAVLHEGKFELIFMDCKMPTGNGFDVIEQVEAEGVDISNLVIMMFPPKHRKSDLVRMSDMGLSISFEKPIGELRVAKAISSLIGRSKHAKRPGQVKRNMQVSDELLHIFILEKCGNTMKKMLQDGPYITTTVDIEHEFFETFKDETFDILIIDLDCLDTDIVDFISELRDTESKLDKIPVNIILVKGSFEDSLMDNLKQFHVSDFLEKPTKKNILIRSMLKHVYDSYL